MAWDAPCSWPSVLSLLSLLACHGLLSVQRLGSLSLPFLVLRPVVQLLPLSGMFLLPNVVGLTLAGSDTPAGVCYSDDPLPLFPTTFLWHRGPR